ncbi:MAG: phosphatidate cytidylyltransferase [Micromonosporaceae bacterium]
MSAYQSPSSGGFRPDSRPAYPQQQGPQYRARRPAAPDAPTGYAVPPPASAPPTIRQRALDPAFPGAGSPAVPAAGDSRAVPSGGKKPGGKAGRNLPAAIGVGVTLGVLVIASLWPWRFAFVLLAAGVIAGAIWEMVRAVEPIQARPPLPPLLIGGPAMVVLAWFAGVEAMVLGLVLTVTAVLIWRLGEGPVGYQRDIVTATLIAAYVPFLAGFAVLLARPEDGHLRVIITIAAVVLSDTGGYAVGALFGRHRMAPTVSPSKSWEGFGGSLLASGIGGALMLSLLLGQEWWQGVVFGVALALSATLGDLSESLMKRDLGIKDMGRLLPGHGGLMDRLDSLLLAAPTGYLLLVLFAPPTG